MGVWILVAQAAGRWNLDLASIWPLEMLRDPDTPKVARWTAHRLSP